MKRDCSCRMAKHVHGTRTAYVVDKCRCDECREASRKEQAERKRLQAYGRYDSGRVDAVPVRAHIKAMAEYGVGLKRLAQLAGVSNSTLGKVLYGIPSRNIPPRARVEKRVADAVLAVRPGIEILGQTVTVDGTGTRRRLQALIAIGWSQSRLASRIGMCPSNFGQTLRATRVYAETARQVKAMYDDLWDKAQHGNDERSQISASRARSYAAKRGWVPPLAWDDDTIDDPNAEPDPGNPTSKGAAVAEDVDFLTRTGASLEEIEQRTGMNWSAIEQLLHRNNRRDLIRAAKNDTRVNARQARKGAAA